MTARVLAAAVGVGLLVIAAIVVASAVVDVPAETFTRDPAALAPGLPWYGGSVSLLSAVVWGVVCALAAFVAWAGSPRLRMPLGLLAALAAILLADDALMLHESVGPRIGIPDEAWYAVYAVLAGLLTWTLRTDLRRGSGVAYLLGGAFLALSVLVDAFNIETSAAFLLEDGAKLIGGVVWITVPVLAWLGQRDVVAAADEILQHEAGTADDRLDEAVAGR